MGVQSGQRRNMAGLAYSQVAGVVGAITLASFFAHFVDWRGAVSELVIWWSTMVRPLVSIFLDPVISFLNGVFGLELRVPVLVEDYLGVGFVLVFSRLRGSNVGWNDGSSRIARSIKNNLVASIGLLVRTILIWPLEVMRLAEQAMFAGKKFGDRSKEDVAGIRLTALLALLPALYFLVLWVVNFMFL